MTNRLLERPQQRLDPSPEATGSLHEPDKAEVEEEVRDLFAALGG